MQSRVSTSPSPLKKSISTPTFSMRAQKLVQREAALTEESEEDDEETLQLQLQAIEARLKLKKLRQAKSRAAGAPHGDTEYGSGRKIQQSQEVEGSSVHARANQRQLQRREERLKKAKSQPSVHVPLSPPLKRAVEEPRSPGRVLLGIDKGLRGRDVSLRRAPNASKTRENCGPILARTGSGALGTEPRSSRPGSSADARAPLKSYSERMAELQAADRSRKEREEKLRKTRSRGFGVDVKEVEAFRSGTASQAHSGRSQEPREFTREEVLQSYNQPTSNRTQLRPSSALRSSKGSEQSRPVSSSTPRSHASLVSDTSTSTLMLNPVAPTAQPSEPPSDDSQFEPFSTSHLSKRLLPHTFLTRTLSGKKTFLIPDLLKIIKSPSYDSPETEGDWVILATVASKSSPKDHKDKVNSKGTGNDTSRGKFMVFTLTDLKWELDLFLFGTGFDRFWKLTPGTVIAILNPSIMPPPPNKVDTGKFSLTLHSSDDTILEIGVSRDLGFCKSIKKDGKPCEQWVDKRHTAFCTFHVDLQLQKAKSGRMEVNTMTAAFAPGGRSGSRSGFFGGRSTKKEQPKHGPKHDWATHSTYYVGRAVPGARATANLFDDDDVDPDAFHRGTSKDERLRRRLAEREKETEIARKLGEGGNGMGGEYLRVKTTEGVEQPGQTIEEREAFDVQTLGLLSGTSDSVRLSPVKNRRMGNAATITAVGWGGAFKRGLPSPRKGAEDEERVKKKTRFVTPNGIKEAGRESLGAIVGKSKVEDDDDDDLEII